MSTRCDRAAERKAVKQAEKDLTDAGTAARKAFDLKDPRFLGQAAVAATRGPAGLAVFGASRGVQAIRERRAERSRVLSDLASDAKQHADALRDRTSVLAPPREKRGGLLRIAPLWVLVLIGGAALAGAAAYFLREPSSSSAPPSPPAPRPTPGPPRTPTPAAEAAATADGGAPSGTGSGSGGSTDASAETGEDLTMDSPDPEGPADQDVDPSPAAGDPTPGPAAGSAPQPSDDEPTGGAGSEK